MIILTFTKSQLKDSRFNTGEINAETVIAVVHC